MVMLLVLAVYDKSWSTLLEQVDEFLYLIFDPEFGNERKHRKNVFYLKLSNSHRCSDKPTLRKQQITGHAGWPDYKMVNV